MDEALLHPSDYSRGYIRGMRRQRYGSAFGTDAEHERYLAMREGQRAAIGIGYAHGLAAADPLWRAEITTVDQIRELCELVGGQSEAARLLGIADRTVRRWCSGARMPDADVVDKIRREAFDTD